MKLSSRMWRSIHNLVAHPLLELYPPLGNLLHDKTENLAFTEPSETEALPDVRDQPSTLIGYEVYEQCLFNGDKAPEGLEWWIAGCYGKVEDGSGYGNDSYRPLSVIIWIREVYKES